MIQMNDFKSEPEDLHRSELCALERVLSSGSFIMGDEGRRFENAWAEFCGARFCVALANGTDAIEIGLRALGIGVGDEVITTPMTAMATVMAVLRAGAVPVLADIDPDTALLDFGSVQDRLSPRTKAVVLVHLYGQARHLDRWKTFCAERGLRLLEDCAQCHGARWNGHAAGTFGEVGAFSFYPTKNLGGKGDGGALITDSEEIAESARSIRNYGALHRNQHMEVGCNSRLDEMQAGVLNARLPWLERFNARRMQIGKRYAMEISNPRVKLLAPPITAESHVYHLFALRCPERDTLSVFLRERGIESLVHYPMPAHKQPFWQKLLYGVPELPHVETHGEQCLSIPCHPQLTDDAVSAVIQAINVYNNPSTECASGVKTAAVIGQKNEQAK